MRAYRSGWQTVVTILVAISLVAGGFRFGWAPLLGSLAALAGVGAIFGLGWVDDRRHRWRAITLSAGWFVLVGLLALCLPVLIGAWALLVLILVGASCPFVAGAALQAYRTRREAHPPADPGPVSPRDLDRQWARTSEQLRDPSLPAWALLRVVQERALLLDEIERRDPDGFVAWLDRAS